MKSVKIIDCNGETLVKVTARKNGTYDIVTLTSIADKIKVEIRDDNNKKVLMLNKRYPVAGMI